MPTDMSVRRMRCSVAFQRVQRGHSASKPPSEMVEGEADNVECPLPFSLQDLCLLVVISDLDSYPEELLASLPLWLRNRLINNLPVLDLCRIENTSVANGVNLQQIWGSRCLDLKSKSNPDFQLIVGQREDIPQSLPQFRFQTRSYQPPLFKKELESALEGARCTTMAASRENYTSMIASDILSSFINSRVSSTLKQTVHKLISVRGEQLLVNLLIVSQSQSISAQSCFNVWKKQATALVLEDVITGTTRLNSRPLFRRIRAAVNTEQEKKEVFLSPERLRSICKNPSALELLSLLGDHCKFQPSSAWIHIEMLSSDVLQNLHSEKLALENGLSCNMAWTSVLNQIMGGVEILRLQCDTYSNIGVMVSLIESVKSKGSGCQLSHVFCTMPDLFMDVIKPFLSLFSLSNFYQLNIEVDNAYPISLSKLIQGFLTLQCSRKQQLVIYVKGKVPAPTITFDESHLAALNLGEATVPPCAVQLKTIKFKVPSVCYSTVYLPLLLQMPTIRLNEITVHGNYLHLCALHPDLQVAKLVIWLVDSKSQLYSIQDDFVSLFKMPSLQELSINVHSDLSCIAEVQVGLTEGLRQRSHCYPLRKISLDISSSGYNKERFQRLWDVIFSLPQLEQLEIVLGEEFTVLTRQFMDVICERWIHVASEKKQLKSLVFTAPYVNESDFKLISLVAQSYSYNV